MVLTLCHYSVHCERLASTYAKTSVSAEQFVVGAGSLEDCQTVTRFPDCKPIASICDVAFVAARPRAFERMHVMPLTVHPL